MSWSHFAAVSLPAFPTFILFIFDHVSLTTKGISFELFAHMGSLCMHSSSAHFYHTFGFIFIYVHLSAAVNVCHLYTDGQRSQERVPEPLEWIAGGCEMLGVDAGN